MNRPDAVGHLLEADGVLLQLISDEEQFLFEPERYAGGVQRILRALPRIGRFVIASVTKQQSGAVAFGRKASERFHGQPTRWPAGCIAAWRGWLIARKGGGWGIRWREDEIAPDGTVKRALRYEALEPMSRRAAANVLAARVSAAQQSHGPLRSRVMFETLAMEWMRTVMPMYKTSTQKNHRHITRKHLVPRFGQMRSRT